MWAEYTTNFIKFVLSVRDFTVSIHAKRKTSKFSNNRCRFAFLLLLTNLLIPAWVDATTLVPADKCDATPADQACMAPPTKSSAIEASTQSTWQALTVATDVGSAPTAPTAEDRPLVNGQRQQPTTFKPLAPKTLSRAEIGELLGWNNAPHSNLICRGYYVEPNLYYPVNFHGPANKAPVTIVADQSILSQLDTSRMSGNVKITQPDRSISADLAYLNRDPITLKPASIDAYGQVILREPGKLAIANTGHFNLADKSGTLSDAIYRMSFGVVDEPITQPVAQPIVNTNVNGWGVAKKVTREPSGVILVEKGTYTACPPSSSVWHIFANRLTLNKDSGRGDAYNATLFIKDMPVMYTPFFSFPLDNRRKTGFLYPTVGHSSTSGYEFGIPFYWNIAPNYDATITPDVLTERGLQLNADFRYLTNSSNGDIHGSFLPNDREFAQFQQDALNDYAPSTPGLDTLEDDSNNRYFVSLRDDRAYNANWSSHLYLNHASDDYYFEDFNSDPAQITDNQILNEGDIYFNSEHWNFAGQLQGYQTLHPINQGFVANQYEKLPELVLTGNYPTTPSGLAFQVNNQFDDFFIAANPQQDTEQPQGTRLYVAPDINYPKYWTWGYIKPDIELTETQYQLHDQVPGEANSINRLLPIIDIDTGLFFDRNTHLFGHNYQQTLEPRLFYLYVPYVNQDDIPLFDTSVQPFSFSQLFMTNRFTGIDRIGDTNQISLAATTRFIDEDTGNQKVEASIGQIYYFEQRRVSIGNEPTDMDLAPVDNEVPNNTLSSPIAADFNYSVSPHWNIDTNAAWDPNYQQTNDANILFQYKTDNRHILNLGYTFLLGGDTFIPPQGSTEPTDAKKNNLSQTDFSAVWPLGQNWTVMGRWNYNLSHDYPQTYFAGLQYDACCWSFRAVVGRDFNYLDNNDKPQFNNEIYFQIALKTLGSLGGSNPSGLLGTIPGYKDTFGQM